MFTIPIVTSFFDFPSSTTTYPSKTLANRQWRGAVTTCTAIKTTWLAPLYSTCYIYPSTVPCGSWEPPQVCNPANVNPQHPWLPGSFTETGKERPKTTDSSFTTGEKVGIAVGSVVGVMVLAILAWCLFRPRKTASQAREPNTKPQEGQGQRRRDENAIPLQGMPAHAPPHHPNHEVERAQREGDPNTPQAQPVHDEQHVLAPPPPPPPPPASPYPPPAQARIPTQPVLRLRGGQGAPNDTEEDLEDMTLSGGAAGFSSNADGSRAPLGAAVILDHDGTDNSTVNPQRSQFHLRHTKESQPKDDA